MNAKTVRETLAHLDGKGFKTREDAEDAVYLVYGKLQPMFTGEGHRDLVDRLIRARWLERIKGEWKFFLPIPTRFTPADGVLPDPTDRPLNTNEFSSGSEERVEALPLGKITEDRDLKALKQLLVSEETTEVQAQSLIDAGYVERIYRITPKGVDYVASKAKARKLPANNISSL